MTASGIVKQNIFSGLRINAKITHPFSLGTIASPSRRPPISRPTFKIIGACIYGTNSDKNRNVKKFIHHLASFNLLLISNSCPNKQARHLFPYHHNTTIHLSVDQ